MNILRDFHRSNQHAPLHRGKPKSRALLLSFAVLATLALSPSSSRAVETIIPYQGRVAVSGSLFTGPGAFRFKLTNADGGEIFWSSDAVSGTSVTVNVENGDFDVRIGDASLSNMADITLDVFTNSPLYLRVWFSDGSNPELELLPASKLTPVPYAVLAETVEDGAITEAKIAAGAVGPGKIGNDAVGTLQLFAAAVTADKLATDAVATDTIITGAVTTAKLANGSVTSEKLAPGGVQSTNIADSAVTAGKLAIASVSSAAIQNGAVMNEDLATDSVSGSKLQDASVNTDELVDSAVATDKLANQAVTTDKLANGAVSNIHIGVGAVTWDRQAPGTPEARLDADGGSLSLTNKVIARQFEYTEPRAFRKHIHGGDFLPLDPAWESEHQREDPHLLFPYDGGNGTNFLAGVHLPEGATAEQIDLLIRVDDEPASPLTWELGQANSTFTMALYRQALTGSGTGSVLAVEELGQVAIPTYQDGGITKATFAASEVEGQIGTAGGGIQRILIRHEQTSEMNHSTIDNANYAYFLKWTWENRFTVNSKGAPDTFSGLVGVQIHYTLNEHLP